MLVTKKNNFPALCYHKKMERQHPAFNNYSQRAAAKIFDFQINARNEIYMLHSLYVTLVTFKVRNVIHGNYNIFIDGISLKQK